MPTIDHGSPGLKRAAHQSTSRWSRSVEIAAYKSLIALVQARGDKSALKRLGVSLKEEEGMAAWLDRNLKKMTLAYLQRERRGAMANR